MQNDSKPGALPDLNYRPNSPPFVELVESIEAQNVLAVDADHGDEIDRLRLCMNGLYAMAAQFAWLFNAPHIAIQNQAAPLLFSTLHKNLIALHTSLKLTRLGLYGPARSMLRHAFEALLIAKFCAISEDAALFSKWKEGGIVYLTNGVLKKIQSPNTEAFTDFWGLLSGYAHATIYAQQVHLNVRETPNEVPLNLAYLRILVDCQHHLLGSHLITPSMQYYSKRYRRGADPLPTIRAEMRQFLRESRSTLLELPRTIVKNYRATWKLIP
ncbi:MAG: hypothetical protein QM740_14685 [Acidovorax sp.]